MMVIPGWHNVRGNPIFSHCSQCGQCPMQSVWTVCPVQSVWTVCPMQSVWTVPGAVSVDRAQCSQCEQCAQCSQCRQCPVQSVWTVPNAVSVNRVPNAVNVDSAQCSQCELCAQCSQCEQCPMQCEPCAQCSQCEQCPMQSVWTVCPMQSVWTVCPMQLVWTVPNAVSVNSAQCSQCGPCGQWAKGETSDFKTHQVRTLHRAVLTLGCSWHACDHDECWVVLSPHPPLISTFSPATGWWRAGTPGTSKTKPSNTSAHTPGWNSSITNDQRQVHSYILSFSHKATGLTVCPFVSSQRPCNEKCAQYFVLSELGVHVHYLSLNTDFPWDVQVGDVCLKR